MIISPSKYTSLNFLKQLSKDNYISKQGREYNEEEARELYIVKSCALAEKLINDAAQLELEFSLQKHNSEIITKEDIETFTKKETSMNKKSKRKSVFKLNSLDKQVIKLVGKQAFYNFNLKATEAIKKSELYFETLMVK